MTCLYDEFPALADTLPRLPLVAAPTPVEPLDFGAERGADGVWVKRDDLSSLLYGGNKVRKLAWLLPPALRRGAKMVLTFGGAGSNHALATALHGAALGLKCASVLGPQHNARAVRRNLLWNLHAGADLRPCPWRCAPIETARCFIGAWRRDGVMPQVIAPGGSSPLGTVGFVEAAFELRGQVRRGLLPEPDVLYVASGTMGTCVGLALGLAAAGMKTRVEAVRVTVAPYTGMARARKLFRAANGLLRDACPDFPECPFPEERFRIRDEFFGGEYALFTPESATMVRMARERFGLKLEGTYTGKAFAALHDDLEAGRLRGETALFWNTHNSREPDPAVEAGDYRRLPKPLHGYFEEPVQPLDREEPSAVLAREH